MKKYLLFILWGIFIISCSKKSKSPNDNSILDNIELNKIHTEIFEKVQMAPVFPDSKTFADILFKEGLDSQKIAKNYLNTSKTDTFDLKKFVEFNYIVEENPLNNFISDTKNSPSDHIKKLWKVLLRDANENIGSKLELPYSYIVPGGRFKEIYYWDSYFTMLGLLEQGEVEIVENMIKNFAYMIDKYGFIPNGSRDYYLSRSQPPYFTMMVNELAVHTKNNKIYDRYFKQILKEYNFWMKGNENLTDNLSSNYRVVNFQGNILNRHFDDIAKPRAEAYKEDVKLAEGIKNKEELYLNLKAACESGWDFSSRWLTDINDLKTIITTQFLPVDLNALIYFNEITISKIYKLKNNNEKSNHFLELASKRADAINNFFWNEELGFYCDVNYTKSKLNEPTLAGMFPLFVNMVEDEERIQRITSYLEKNFLKDGGLITTKYNTGQQWDAPNGWAPLQWIAVKGLLNYKQNTLAKEIAKRWTNLNYNFFKETGKMTEKYNVENSTNAGGGEYPNQDGFGWTNSVYLKMVNVVKK